MLEAAKSSLEFWVKFLKQTHGWENILKREMLIRTLSTTLFQMFCKIIHNFLGIVKSYVDPDNNF